MPPLAKKNITLNDADAETIEYIQHPTVLVESPSYFTNLHFPKNLQISYHHVPPNRVQARASHPRDGPKTVSLSLETIWRLPANDFLKDEPRLCLRKR